MNLSSFNTNLHKMAQISVEGLTRMITWMQRHKKYLIVTIWISTIAFVGAGFVGWGQYSYGDKAGAVAKVGEIELTRGDLQKAYSNLYMQYNQMFQGNFDEEKAKSFGLQRQALKQLSDQALLLNLALSYDLSVSDKELLDEITSQEYFLENGAFSKELYKRLLSNNRLSMKEYEADMKKQILINKLIALLPVQESQNESLIMDTLLSIADKIEYKVLESKNIKLDTSDTKLKEFWESRKNSFMSDVAYEIKYIKQKNLTQEYSDAKIATYYNDNKTHFKGNDGKIIALENAKEEVIKELNANYTKEQALRTYIAFKKDKLESDIKVQETTISNEKNSFNQDVLNQISEVSPDSPYLKPLLVNDNYYVLKLEKIIPSQPKTFEQAKAEVLPLYKSQETKKKLLELANSSLNSFKGKTTDFVTLQDAQKLSFLSPSEANEFLTKLFETEKKRAFIALDSGKIVLYDILEQKLLQSNDANQNNSIVRLKSAMFNEGLIKTLQKKYNTEIFIEGL